MSRRKALLGAGGQAFAFPERGDFVACHTLETCGPAIRTTAIADFPAGVAGAYMVGVFDRPFGLLAARRLIDVESSLPHSGLGAVSLTLDARTAAAVAKSVYTSN